MSTPTTTAVTLEVDGQRRSVGVESDRTLVQVLREDLELTGTKASCEMGDCGSCTVLLDGAAVYSCLVLAVECEGRRVETVDGLATGQELTALQQAFVERDALQCGFCTPGQLLALESLRRRDPSPSAEDVRKAVEGNLCRCGAYQHIVDAACRAFGVAVEVDR